MRKTIVLFLSALLFAGTSRANSGDPDSNQVQFRIWVTADSPAQYVKIVSPEECFALEKIEMIPAYFQGMEFYFKQVDPDGSVNYFCLFLPGLKPLGLSYTDGRLSSFNAPQKFSLSQDLFAGSLTTDGSYELEAKFYFRRESVTEDDPDNMLNNEFGIFNIKVTHFDEHDGLLSMKAGFEGHSTEFYAGAAGRKSKVKGRFSITNFPVTIVKEP